MRLRALRRDAVHRPLERPAVDADGVLAAALERDADRAGEVAGRAHPDGQRRQAADAQRREALAVRAVALTRPTRAVAERRAGRCRRRRRRRRPCTRVRLLARSGLAPAASAARLRVEPGEAGGAACDEAHEGHEERDPKDQASPGSLAIGSGTSSANGSRVPAVPGGQDTAARRSGSSRRPRGTRPAAARAARRSRARARAPG